MNPSAETREHTVGYGAMAVQKTAGGPVIGFAEEIAHASMITSSRINQQHELLNNYYI